MVWSADSAPELEGALRTTFAGVDHLETEVVLGTRNERYHTYTAVKGAAASGEGALPSAAGRGAADEPAGSGATCPAP